MRNFFFEILTLVGKFRDSSSYIYNNIDLKKPSYVCPQTKTVVLKLASLTHHMKRRASSDGIGPFELFQGPFKDPNFREISTFQRPILTRIRTSAETHFIIDVFGQHNKQQHYCQQSGETSTWQKLFPTIQFMGILNVTTLVRMG